jgi:predicted ATPase
MITKLRAKYFKSWQDSGDIRIAPLTGFFGTNSSGKTAILQLLLMLKQTVEAVDRQRVLETRGAYVDLGTFSDILHKHQIPGKIHVSVDWNLPNLLEIPDLESEPDRTLFSIPALRFATTIQGTVDSIFVEEFAYSFNQDSSNYKFGMRRQNESDRNTDSTSQNDSEYDLIHSGYSLKRNRGLIFTLNLKSDIMA